MKIRQNGQNSCTVSLNCLKLNRNMFYSSLFVVIVGVFLLPKIVFAAPLTPDNIIDLTNKERKKAEITSLYENEQLNKAATAKGGDILRTQVFDHNIGKKKFSSWISDTGYEYSYAGENLAIDFITSEGLMKAWIESKAHKKNLLNPNYKEIGVAVLNGNFDNQNTIIVVQIFGTRLRTIVPPEILKKNEQLIPYRGEVLSANTYYNQVKDIQKKYETNFLAKNASLIISLFSVLVTSFATYLYFLFVTYLIEILSNRRNTPL